MKYNVENKVIFWKVWLMLVFITYVLTVFVMLELNPLEWSLKGRLWFATLIALEFIMVAGVLADESNKI